MRLLELAGVVLIFRMALLEAVGMIAEASRVVDVTIAAAAESRIGAAVEPATTPLAKSPE
jgi:hypothetical protein